MQSFLCFVSFLFLISFKSFSTSKLSSLNKSTIIISKIFECIFPHAQLPNGLSVPMAYKIPLFSFCFYIRSKKACRTAYLLCCGIPNSDFVVADYRKSEPWQPKARGRVSGRATRLSRQSCHLQAIPI